MATKTDLGVGSSTGANPSVLEYKATLIAQEMSGNTATPAAGLGGFGTLLPIILQVLTTLFQAFGQCNAPVGTVKKSITHPGPLQKRSLKRTIRQHTDNPALHAPMYDATLKVGQGSSDSDISAMYKEVSGK